MTNTQILQQISETGLTYSDFMAAAEERLQNTDPDTLDEEGRDYFSYLPINIQRSNRIYRTFKLTDEIGQTLPKIETPQIWMVITEDWCGDSAQSLPVIARIAEENPNITMRILERDKYPEIMDRYLTNGTSRSIPILVAYTPDGDELFKWGPRPQEGADLFKELKAEGQDKIEINEKLHLWYGRNRGKAIAGEIDALLDNILTVN